MNDSIAPMETTTESLLDRVVSRTRRLYSLPTVAARVLELTEQDMVDVRALRECIEVDPALTAKILRVANSSMFGRRTEVKDVGQAIGIVGIKSFKMLVLGFSLPADLTKDLPAETMQRFWRHTLYRAVAARSLAVKVWQQSGDDAFLAGLLGGVGMLALLQDLGATYLTFLEHVWSTNSDLAEQELGVLGFDHAVLSARMLEQWGLPTLLVEAISRSRDLNRIVALPDHIRQLHGSLHLAELAAMFLVTRQPEWLRRLQMDSARLAGWTTDEVAAAIEQLESEIASLAELFAIAAPTQGEFAGLITESQRRLAELSERMIQDSEGDRPYVALLHDANDLHRQMRRALGESERATPESKQTVGHASATSRPKALKAPLVSLATKAATVVEECRSRRSPLSLLIVAVDRFDDVILLVGAQPATKFLAQLEKACEHLVGDASQVLPDGEGRFVLFLADQHRNEAVAIGRKLIAFSRNKLAALDPSLRISIGVATVTLPPRNFAERELIDAARRCLQAAQSSGGDAVKSIEI